MSIAVVNTSIVPTCFSCLDVENRPAFMPSFFFASQIIPLNADVTQTANQIFVTNFNSFSLLLDGVLNIFRCVDSAGNLALRNVSTLSKLYHLCLWSLGHILIFSFFSFSFPFFYFYFSCTTKIQLDWNT